MRREFQRWVGFWSFLICCLAIWVGVSLILHPMPLQAVWGFVAGTCSMVVALGIFDNREEKLTTESQGLSLPASEATPPVQQFATTKE